MAQRLITVIALALSALGVGVGVIADVVCSTTCPAVYCENLPSPRQCLRQGYCYTIYCPDNTTCPINPYKKSEAKRKRNKYLCFYGGDEFATCYGGWHEDRFTGYCCRC